VKNVGKEYQLFFRE